MESTCFGAEKSLTSKKARETTTTLIKTISMIKKEPIFTPII
jgi:hypothetical protein